MPCAAFRRLCAARGIVRTGQRDAAPHDRPALSGSGSTVLGRSGSGSSSSSSSSSVDGGASSWQGHAPRKAGGGRCGAQPVLCRAQLDALLCAALGHDAERAVAVAAGGSAAMLGRVRMRSSEARCEPADALTARQFELLFVALALRCGRDTADRHVGDEGSEDAAGRAKMAAPLDERVRRFLHERVFFSPSTSTSY